MKDRYPDGEVKHTFPEPEEQAKGTGSTTGGGSAGGGAGTGAANFAQGSLYYGYPETGSPAAGGGGTGIPTIPGTGTGGGEDLEELISLPVSHFMIVLKL